MKDVQLHHIFEKLVELEKVSAQVKLLHSEVQQLIRELPCWDDSSMENIEAFNQVMSFIYEMSQGHNMRERIMEILRTEKPEA